VRPWAAVFGKDEKEVLTGGDDGSVRVWDVNSGKHLRELKGHVGPVTWLAYRPGNRHQVLSAGADGTLRLWDLDARQPGKPAKVDKADNPVKEVKPVKDVREFREFRDHTGRVNCVAFNNTGALAISGGEDRTVRVLQIDAAKPEGVPLPGGHQ